jgi:SPP1 gp7 family putative phage head morphogenesis protein
MASKTVKIKRDPAKAKRLINQYEGELVSLFTAYHLAVHNGLRLPTRALASEGQPPFDPRTIEQVIADATPRLLWKGGLITRQATLQAYTHGQKYADLQLKRAGVKVEATFFREADARAIDILQTRNLTALKGITDDVNKRIVSELTDGMMKGEGADLLARRLADAIDTIGINRARMMARTETMYSLNQATMTRFYQQGVDKVEWIAGADGRCCDECLANNGKVWPITSVPSIPVHPQCRCSLSPARRAE